MAHMGIVGFRVQGLGYECLKCSSFFASFMLSTVSTGH